VCDVTHPCARHVFSAVNVSSMCETCVRHDSSMRETCVRHDFAAVEQGNHGHDLTDEMRTEIEEAREMMEQVTCLIHLCDMTRSFVCRDSCVWLDSWI